MSTMKTTIAYTAIFEKCENGDFFVEFPDLEGCFTQGNTFEDALFNAQEALAIYYKEKQGDVPMPSSFVEIQQKNKKSKGIVQLVAIDINNYILKSTRTIKKTLTIPEWLDVIANKYNVNYSQILRQGLVNYLKDLNEVSLYDKKMLNS